MPIRIVVVGQDRNDPLKIEAERYLSRTHARLKCDSFYVRESKRKDDPRQAMDEEGKEILKHTQGYYRIAMDLSGKMMSSEAFAKKIEERLLYQPSPVAFIIGGATGLSAEVLAAVNEKCALSPMTLPHRLAFLVLAEQVYRAGEILRGGPYHK